MERELRSIGNVLQLHLDGSYGNVFVL
jgi:hypothetical protein